MKEIWKPVLNYEDRYLISNTGKIFSMKSQQLKKASQDKDGYLFVTLHGCEKPVKKFIHTLVLENFVGERPSSDAICRHYPDQTKTNNNLDNLSWSTCAQNTRDIIEIHNTVKLTELDVIQIKSDLLNNKYTAAEIARKYNISPQSVSNIISGKTWKDIGPDISQINFDKRRQISELEISQIKTAINIGIDSNSIRSYFNIDYNIFHGIKQGRNYKQIIPCLLENLPFIPIKTAKSSKLSEIDVLEIRRLIQQGILSLQVIADKYNVNTKTIYSIKNNISHKQI